MKAEELRIGNTVFNIDANKATEIQGPGIQKQKEFEITGRPLPYRSVPLTEEWLLKFGFKFLIGSWRYVIGSISGPYYKYDVELNYIKPDKFKYDRIEILYVHQLQNLYFALTGTELTIKS